MNLVSANIPGPWLVALWVAVALLFWQLGRRAAWPILGRSENQRVFLVASAVVLGLWLIKTGIKPGLNFHLLGASALTLMFRPWFAILGLSLVTAAITLHNGEFAAFPANLLIMGALPVTVSWLIYRQVDSKLPNNLFVYIFLNGFFGSALAIGTVGLATTLFAATAEAYPLAYLLDEYLPFYLLIAWSEAFATGMLITLMVVYRPEWVATFDDRRYLQSK